MNPLTFSELFLIWSGMNKKHSKKKLLNFFYFFHKSLTHLAYIYYRTQYSKYRSIPLNFQIDLHGWMFPHGDLDHGHL